MYLFIDCETTGPPKNYRAPVDDLDNWPRLVQLAWARYDAKHRHLKRNPKSSSRRGSGSDVTLNVHTESRPTGPWPRGNH